MTQLTELDYQTIENAVMETARGRWFLAEHQKRHGGTDTPTILDAISRLEKVITSINQTAPVGPHTAEPSKSPFTPAAIDIPTAPESSTPESNSLSEENLQFFSNDEDLFANDSSPFLSNAETGDGSKNLAKPSEPVEVAETEPAPVSTERFKIFKKPSVAEQPDSTAPQPDASVPDPALQPTAEEQDRIVVIRNTAGEDVDIPLSDELEDLSLSDDSTPAAS